MTSSSKKARTPSDKQGRRSSAGGAPIRRRKKASDAPETARQPVKAPERPSSLGSSQKAGRAHQASSSKGRRLYEPKGKVGSESPEDLEKRRLRVIEEEQKWQAEAMAKEKGIPLPQAYRVVRDETTLSEVLKGMMHKSRTEHLRRTEGFDKELAGQVASGNLTKERAHMIMHMRRRGLKDPKKDAFKRIEKDDGPILFGALGEEAFFASIKAVEKYDLQLVLETGAEATTVSKHQIKCFVENRTGKPFGPQDMKALFSLDKALSKRQLGGSQLRKERVKISDAVLLKALSEEAKARFVFRDGTILEGQVMAVGYWDVLVQVAPGLSIVVFFHALHESSKTLGFTF